jgi:hypothetical protein
VVPYIIKEKQKNKIHPKERGYYVRPFFYPTKAAVSEKAAVHS